MPMDTTRFTALLGALIVLSPSVVPSCDSHDRDPLGRRGAINGALIRRTVLHRHEWSARPCGG